MLTLSCLNWNFAIFILTVSPSTTFAQTERGCIAIRLESYWHIIATIILLGCFIWVLAKRKRWHSRFAYSQSSQWISAFSKWKKDNKTKLNFKVSDLSGYYTGRYLSSQTSARDLPEFSITISPANQVSGSGNDEIGCYNIDGHLHFPLLFFNRQYLASTGDKHKNKGQNCHVEVIWVDENACKSFGISAPAFLGVFKLSTKKSCEINLIVLSTDPFAFKETIAAGKSDSKAPMLDRDLTLIPTSSWQLWLLSLLLFVGGAGNLFLTWRMLQEISNEIHFTYGGRISGFSSAITGLLLLLYCLLYSSKVKKPLINKKKPKHKIPKSLFMTCVVISFFICLYCLNRDGRGWAFLEGSDCDFGPALDICTNSQQHHDCVCHKFNSYLPDLCSSHQDGVQECMALSGLGIAHRAGVDTVNMSDLTAVDAVLMRASNLCQNDMQTDFPPHLLLSSAVSTALAILHCVALLFWYGSYLHASVIRTSGLLVDYLKAGQIMAPTIGRRESESELSRKEHDLRQSIQVAKHTILVENKQDLKEDVDDFENISNTRLPPPAAEVDTVFSAPDKAISRAISSRNPQLQSNQSQAKSRPVSQRIASTKAMTLSQTKSISKYYDETDVKLKPTNSFRGSVNLKEIYQAIEEDRPSISISDMPKRVPSATKVTPELTSMLQTSRKLSARNLMQDQTIVPPQVQMTNITDRQSMLQNQFARELGPLPPPPPQSVESSSVSFVTTPLAPLRAGMSQRNLMPVNAGNIPLPPPPLFPRQPSAANLQQQMMQPAYQPGGQIYPQYVNMPITNDGRPYSVSYMQEMPVQPVVMNSSGTMQPRPPMQTFLSSSHMESFPYTHRDTATSTIGQQQRPSPSMQRVQAQTMTQEQNSFFAQNQPTQPMYRPPPPPERPVSMAVGQSSPPSTRPGLYGSPRSIRLQATQAQSIFDEVAAFYPPAANGGGAPSPRRTRANDADLSDDSVDDN